MVVGLTGGIGTGKTTVAKMFVELGVPVYNSDRQAKKLMQSSEKVRRAVQDLLGKDAYLGKKLNRKYISNKVFKDNDLLQKLNAIVHPAVREHFLEWTKKKNSPYVIQEAAIIFENASQERYDKIILITAPLKLRIKRIMKRDHLAKTDILERIDKQWTDAEKIPLSDFVIENVDLDSTRSKIKEVHDRLLEYI